MGLTSVSIEAECIESIISDRYNDLLVELKLHNSQIKDAIRTLFDSLPTVDQNWLLQDLLGEKPVFEDHPNYHSNAMGCGLEDRSIRDPYAAMEHGWQKGVDHMTEAFEGWLEERIVGDPK